MKQDPFAKIGSKLAAARAPFATTPRPPGAFTCPEYAAHFKVSPESARKELIKLVNLGKVKKSGIRPAYYTFNE